MLGGEGQHFLSGLVYRAHGSLIYISFHLILESIGE
jgi:hypothetical protein